MSTIETLRSTAARLSNQTKLPRARWIWGGAGVIVTTLVPPPQEDSYPVYVVTPFASEVSWLFYRLRDAFYEEDRVDYFSKYEFFGRLADAANRCIAQGLAENAVAICWAILQEGFAFYEEQETKRLDCLPVDWVGTTWRTRSPLDQGWHFEPDGKGFKVYANRKTNFTWELGTKKDTAVIRFNNMRLLFTLDSRTRGEITLVNNGAHYGLIKATTTPVIKNRKEQ